MSRKTGRAPDGARPNNLRRTGRSSLRRFEVAGSVAAVLAFANALAWFVRFRSTADLVAIGAFPIRVVGTRPIRDAVPGHRTDVLTRRAGADADTCAGRTGTTRRPSAARAAEVIADADAIAWDEARGALNARVLGRADRR